MDQRGENRFKLQEEAEKSSKNGASNGKKCYACDSSDHLITDTHKAKKHICHIKERREITEKKTNINIIEEYGTIKKNKSSE